MFPRNLKVDTTSDEKIFFHRKILQKELHSTEIVISLIFGNIRKLFLSMTRDKKERNITNL